jgi:hypothetical protein
VVGVTLESATSKTIPASYGQLRSIWKNAPTMPAPRVAKPTTKAAERFPFALAINAPGLLKPRFDRLSLPQKTILKAFYGLPLETQTELDFWSVSQGGATYDDLGYVKTLTQIPYHPKEYDTLVLYVGRRSGKTDSVMATIAAYEITLGGHTRFARPGQQLKVPFIAQTAGDAQVNMNFVRMAVEESPKLVSQLAEEQVASEIRFTNGIVVDPLPANKSVGRGHGIPVLLADETSYWYTDPNAANPDFEVFRAIQYAQMQFPDGKTVIATTPWAEQGVAYKNFIAGTEGRNLKCDACRQAKELFCEHPVEDRDEYEGVLVVHASTAAMENPVNTRKRLIQIRKRDPEAFPRESLALTLKSVSGWLSAEKVEKAIQIGRFSIPARKEGITYIAAIDPAFRKDSFALTILHHDIKRGIVQDFIRYWEPQPGAPLKPGEILDEIKTILDSYHLGMVYSDQYQLESLQQLAMDRGFIINGYDFTGKSKAVITGGFKVVLDQERIELLDHELQKTQLLQLQRQALQSGQIRIAAPPGKHDDLAMVLILGCRIVMWLMSGGDAPKIEQPKNIDSDHVKMGLDQIDRRRREALAYAED